MHVGCCRVGAAVLRSVCPCVVAIVVRSTIAIDKCRACASAPKRSGAETVAHSANVHTQQTRSTARLCTNPDRLKRVY